HGGGARRAPHQLPSVATGAHVRRSGGAMIRFRDLPIRRKLLLMTLTSTTVALAFASAGFLGWDLAQFRSEARQDMRAQSAIVAENSGAPLTFGDDRVGREILETLKARPRVEMACLYQSGGTVLTSFQREPGGA